MELFLAIAITHFIALLSPGPDFFLILTTLLARNKIAAKQVCLGIALGNAIILLAVFSSWYLIGKMDVLTLTYLKWSGVGYLLYLSFLCFRYANSKIEIIQVQPSLSHFRGLKQILLGLQSSLLNPKNILFYSSLTLLVAEKFNVYQKIIVSVWMVMVVLLWNLFLVRLLSFDQWQTFLSSHSKWIYYVSGICFVIFAVFMMVII
ncbi:MULTISPECIES: LysE family translocator [unclassified Acinetobacter]|uniref:LysE family translocator n=1 Tax=unclassified Acinetobacter TaxID=196816 RepID=UPI00190C99C4|nr:MULTISPECIES: LysE family translocator [unclassified Acinetobacter]MBK0063065.1 LysE family translocator [Acinetobacter sp. S55]MBK0066517.1 LysE family translocator [Acinetobacter sp. S54]